MQNILLHNNIRIPAIYKKLENNKIKFPIFCKENIHAGIVFKAYTENTLNKFFDKFSYRDFYIEESIDGQSESKYYYIRGNLYSKGKSKIESQVKQICEKIANVLDLEIFSVDIIKQNNEYIVIDVNPSAGFYLLDEARNKFINELEKEIKRK